MDYSTVDNDSAQTFDWHPHLLEGYRRDAERAIERARGGDPRPQFVERILELLRTYVEIPGVGEQPQLADERILQLAQLTVGRIRRMGYWREMNHLWPRLCAIAEYTVSPDRYIIFVKFMATAKGYVGQVEEELAIYAQLINHPHFQNTAPTLQANLLSTYATALVWRGQRSLAAPLLRQCLEVTSRSVNSHRAGHEKTDAEPPLEAGITPLWETHAYALNQQGVLHMFCGEFVQAHKGFDKMAAIFLEHGQKDNLACVAHQAKGRLLLYEKKFAEALDLLAQGLKIRTRWVDLAGIAVNSTYMAAAHIGLQQFDAAEALLTDAFRICRELDNQHDLALCHLYLGLLAQRRIQPEQATYHWQALATIATQAVLHFVELRILLEELPALFYGWRYNLAYRLLHMLWQSLRHDQLGLDALWRFSKL